MDSQWAKNRSKFFSLSMSTPTWAYQPIPLLHKLNFIKSPIKNYNTFISGQFVIKIKIKLSFTWPNIKDVRLHLERVVKGETMKVDKSACKY